MSTWGDRHYVGMNGIDIFDEQGYILQYKPINTIAVDNNNIHKNTTTGNNTLKHSSIQSSQVNICTIKANPSDINILSEYEGDPRVVDNLLTSPNFTRDDLHVWLAPTGEMAYEAQFDVRSKKSKTNNNSNTKISEEEGTASSKGMTYITDTAGQTHGLVASISLTLSAPTRVAMIRLWNFNKSRAHCMRGVRRVRLIVDDERVIFDG